MLNGHPALQPSASNFKVDPEIDKTIRAHMAELKKIASGEISAEEFKTLTKLNSDIIYEKDRLFRVGLLLYSVSKYINTSLSFGRETSFT